ncbi:MAG: DNA polymerase III subunit delta [Burkholderiales bacterium]|nr:DNA polymerase III subunit delta [Burkholderiales bacterium]
MRIDSEQLPQSLARAFASLYTIVGEEPLLALEAVDRLRAHARSLGYAERTLLVVEAGFDWGSLAAAGASLSLFAERRLIELRIANGKPGTAGAEAIERYASKLAPDTVTLVALPGVDRKTTQARWFQALERHGSVVDARSVERPRLPRWLAGRLTQNGQSADDATLQFIADRVEGNLLAAWQEVQKLALLFAPGKLAADAVRKAVLDVARFDIDDASLALLRGEAAHYVRIVDHLQAEGAALPLVLWGLANDVRSAYLAAAAIARGTAVASALQEVRAYGARRGALEAAAKRWSATELERALVRCAEIDRLAKGLGSGNAWDEIRNLGVELTRAGPAAPSRARVAV